MAKFGEKAFEFGEILKYNTIPVSCAGDRWFLNVGKNSVVNVHDQKTLQTWTLMHPHCFTCSIVHFESYLYCVMDNNVLMKWSIDEDNLENAEKVEFKESVFAVIPVDGGRPLVIFDSGKFAAITSAFYDIKPSDFVYLKRKEEIVWADACASGENTEVFCLAFNKKKKFKILYNFSLNKENSSEPHIFNLKFHHKQKQLKSWCLNHHNALFLSLWSDGTICSHNIKESKDVDLLSINTSEAMLTTTFVNFYSIDSTHIALARVEQQTKECVLEIWDLKCGILKAQKVLKTPNVNYLQVAVQNSHMLLCFNQEVISVSFKIEDATFFAALGMSESTEYAYHTWNADLELQQFTIKDEPEAMDVCSQDSLASVQSMAEKLLNDNSTDTELMCIPECELVKLFQLAISFKKEENSDKKSFEKIHTLLNNIFSTHFNDVLLVKYLKKMNFEETLIALDLLLSFLNRTIKIPPNIAQRSSDLQIVNWMCLIIQSHTEVLMFSKDKTSSNLLKQLEKAIASKMEEYEDFDCIQNYFSIIGKKDILPQKCSLGKYCIETLEI